MTLEEQQRAYKEGVERGVQHCIDRIKSVKLALEGDVLDLKESEVLVCIGLINSLEGTLENLK